MSYISEKGYAGRIMKEAYADVHNISAVSEDCDYLHLECNHTDMTPLIDGRPKNPSLELTYLDEKRANRVYYGALWDMIGDFRQWSKELNNPRYTRLHPRYFEILLKFEVPSSRVI